MIQWGGAAATPPYPPPPHIIILTVYSEGNSLKRHKKSGDLILLVHLNLQIHLLGLKQKQTIMQKCLHLLIWSPADIRRDLAEHFIQHFNIKWLIILSSTVTEASLLIGSHHSCFSNGQHVHTPLRLFDFSHYNVCCADILEPFSDAAAVLSFADSASMQTLGRARKSVGTSELTWCHTL